jgi:hypothetical protein
MRLLSYIAICAVLIMLYLCCEKNQYIQYWRVVNCGVIFIEMCSTDHFWQCCNIYRYVQYWSFLSVLIYISICELQTISDSAVIYIYVYIYIYISIYDLETVSDSAVIYIDMCNTDHFWPCWYIYISICELQTVSDSAVIFRIQWIFYPKHCSKYSNFWRCGLT